MIVVPSEAPAQCGSDWIFDNKVERASREKSFEFKFERSHKLNQFAVVLSGMAAVHRPPSVDTSGFKREFDPGSESTLAACLTHASRTRKWSNP
jgi:hypothetical protein